jgi:hypothetical protein
MIAFPRFASKPPSLKTLPLKRYLIDFSLSRLALGVDNLHIDVRISPLVHSAVKGAASVLMIKYSHCENFFENEKKDRRENEKIALRQVCAKLLRETINRAKSESEVQIDFLGQFSLAKLFLEEIDEAYHHLITKFGALIRAYELSRQVDQLELFRIKEKLTEIKHNQKRLIRLVGEELFQLLADIHAKTLRSIRESNFPAGDILPDSFFTNPTLHTDHVADDFLLMDSYALLGQRSDDPDNYGNYLSIIRELLVKTDLGRYGTAVGVDEEGETGKADVASADPAEWDPWLMELGNIDLMFDCFDSREQYASAKRRKESTAFLLGLKSRMRIQKRMLDLFYRRFKTSGLIKCIVAAHEMKNIYRAYCPPLRPLQVQEYLVKRGSRKNLVRELKRRKSSGGTDFSLAPLHETVRRINRSGARKKKECLLIFLKDFFRYHRDLENGRLLKQAMGAISLVRDEKTELLSKKNRLLYEFLLPEERVTEEKPVIGHVIIKADIRGSVGITHTMRARGLNPASHFSLNFFDPISEILGDYGASKVFIEGDAIILSIHENDDPTQGHYSVARACGLAVTMLHIVRQYNIKNREHDLPVLELGIGIAYKPSPPAFLFDGDSRIMISEAINLADRLSGCDKRLLERKDHDRIFNLSVFQNRRDADAEATPDDLFLRYNVDGIELHREAFVKLAGEINLTSIDYPAGNEGKTRLYSGKAPTVSGKVQSLVIREAAVLELKPDSLDVIGPTSNRYYEVCTRQAVHQFVENHDRHQKP